MNRSLLLLLLCLLPASLFAALAKAGPAPAAGTVAAAQATTESSKQAAEDDASEANKPADKSPSQQDTSKRSKPTQAVTTKKPAIWIEKKVTPVTRWVEGAMQPLTTWMEDKIHKPGANTSPLAGEQQRTILAPNSQTTLDPSQGHISPERASAIALGHYAGQILRVSLLDRSPVQYRVKMITMTGEIQLLYIRADDGALIKPKPRLSTDSSGKHTAPSR